MGIKGLLKAVEKAMTDCKLSDPEFQGKRVGIDAFIYLYRYEMLKPENKEVSWEKGINMVCDMMELLKRNGVIPVVIFDGQKLLAKKVTHDKRQAMKENMQKKLRDWMEKKNNYDKPDTKEQYKHAEKKIQRISRQVNINSKGAAKGFIDYLRKNKQDYIVAPFEADAQLASLDQQNVIDFILTEDSDLIVYGCRYILYKLDREGYGQLYDQRKLASALGEDPTKFSFDNFVDRCILSGCDYLPNMYGIGFQKAKNIITQSEEDEVVYVEVMKDFPQKLNGEGNSIFNFKEYEQFFIVAKRTFKHQVVFNFNKKAFTHLHPLPHNLIAEDVLYAGDLMTEIENPMDYVLQNISRDESRQVHRVGVLYDHEKNCPLDSIWNSNFKISETAGVLNPRKVTRPVRKRKAESFQKEGYFCTDCGHISLTKYGMERHFLTHSGQKPEICKICGLAFSTKQGVVSHNKNKHGGVKPYVCNFENCEKAFVCYTNLKAHKQTHTKGKTFKCKFCDQLFQTEKNVTAHGWVCDRVIGLGNHCKICKRAYPTAEKLKKHSRNHKNQRIFRCQFCCMWFRRESNLQEHNKNHKSSKPYECRTCRRNFSTIIKLVTHSFQKNHMLTDLQRGSDCIVCGRQQIKFLKDGQLRNHLLTHINFRKFHCEKCGIRFKHPNSLSRHKKENICDGSFLRRDYQVSIVGNRSPKPKQVSNPDGDDNKNKKVPNKIGFKSKIKIFPCTQCGKTFSRKESLAQHFPFHSQKLKFKCKFCGLCLKYKSSLIKHIKLHEWKANNQLFQTEKLKTASLLRSYPCNKCHKMFYRQDALKEHLPVHSDKKMYKCEACATEFKYHSSLRRHNILCARNRAFYDTLNEIIHSEKQFQQIIVKKKNKVTKSAENKDRTQFQCEICGKKFDLRFSLRNHLRIHPGYKQGTMAVQNSTEVEHLGEARSFFAQNPKSDQTVTALNSFTCPICCQNCGSQAHLERHLRKRHP